MSRVWIIFIVVAGLLTPVKGQDPNRAPLAAWSVFNGDQITGRVGWAEKHFEMGLETTYRDDLSPGDLDAYAVGLYGLFVVNPEAQFPIRGWIPGALEFLPESIPISLYLGAKCDLEFEGHHLMPAFLLGGHVKTGAHGSVGVEWQHAFNKWENVTQITDADAFMALLRWRF